MPPRTFLERPFPQNLLTVPSCIKCNSGFSKDEQYVLILIAHISTASTLTSKLEAGGTVDRALSRAPALDERIIESLEVDGTGRINIQPELNRVNRILEKISLGLFAHRYSRIPDSSSLKSEGAFPYNIKDFRSTQYFLSTFTERFQKKRWSITQPGVFSYIFVRHPRRNNKLWCIMDFHNTLWGVVLCPHPNSINKMNARQLSMLSQ